MPEVDANVQEHWRSNRVSSTGRGRDRSHPAQSARWGPREAAPGTGAARESSSIFVVGAQRPRGGSLKHRVRVGLNHPDFVASADVTTANAVPFLSANIVVPLHASSRVYVPPAP